MGVFAGVPGTGNGVTGFGGFCTQRTSALAACRSALSCLLAFAAPPWRRRTAVGLRASADIACAGLPVLLSTLSHAALPLATASYAAGIKRLALLRGTAIAPAGGGWAGAPAFHWFAAWGVAAGASLFLLTLPDCHSAQRLAARLAQLPRRKLALPALLRATCCLRRCLPPRFHRTVRVCRWALFGAAGLALHAASLPTLLSRTFLPRTPTLSFAFYACCPTRTFAAHYNHSAWTALSGSDAPARPCAPVPPLPAPASLFYCCRCQAPVWRFSWRVPGGLIWCGTLDCR